MDWNTPFNAHIRLIPRVVFMNDKKKQQTEDIPSPTPIMNLGGILSPSQPETS